MIYQTWKQNIKLNLNKQNYTALETMKKNPELTISDAIKIGFDKWV